MIREVGLKEMIKFVWFDFILVVKYWFHIEYFSVFYSKADVPPFTTQELMKNINDFPHCYC